VLDLRNQRFEFHECVVINGIDSIDDADQILQIDPLSELTEKGLKEAERIRFETAFCGNTPSVDILVNEVEIPNLVGMFGEEHEDCPFLRVSVPT